MKLGNRIKRLREAKGISGSKFCYGIISPSHYSNIENSRYTPSYDTILLIAEKLAVPKDYLLNVYEEDFDLAQLLKKVDILLIEGDIKNIKIILKKHTEKFTFIPSLLQEFNFELINFLIHIKLNKVEDALNIYTNKISKIEIDSASLSYLLKEKYNHVTGLYYFYMKDFKKSIHYFKEVIEINNDPLVTAKISFNIALSLIHLYKYREALTHVEIANNIYLKKHDWNKTGDTYNTIAFLYRELGMLKESEEYIKKGFDIIDEESELLQARLYHNLALVYKDQEDYENSLKNVEKSIQLKENNQKVDIFLSHYLKLNILLSNQDIIALKRALPIAMESLKSEKDESLYLFIKAKLHFLLDEFVIYEASMKKCISIFINEKDWENVRDAAEHYACFLEKENKYKKALEYQKLSNYSLKKIFQEESF